MTKTILKSIHLHDFKGVKDSTYHFNNITHINGMNGSGKSTIATAWFWVMADKDYSLKSNPMIRPLDMEESEPSVTLTLDINGVEVTVKKSQICKKSEPDENGVAKVALNNKYEVNSVPVSERDFKKKMTEYGIDLDKVLALSHTSVFTSQKAADMRKILFEMTSTKSDVDIAGMESDTAELAELLKSYSVEEVEAMHKASKKKADENVKSIPDQIIGLEQAKVTDDIALLEEKKKAAEQTLEELNNPNTEIEESQREKFSALLEIQTQITEIEQTAQQESAKAKQKAVEHLMAVREKVSNAEKAILNLEAKEVRCKADLAVYNDSKERIIATFKETKAKEFVAKPIEDTCPTCGQSLPEKTKAKAREAQQKDKELWEKKKTETLAEIRKEANELNDNLTKAEEEYKAIKAQIDDLNYELPKLKKEAEFAEKKAEEDFTAVIEDENYELLKARAVQIKEEMKAEAETIKPKDNEAIIAAEQELEYINNRIALVERNKEIDEKIKALQTERMNYEQEKANAEMILDQLAILSRRKNELLVEEINSKFKTVKFTLFEFLKNGNYSEVCIPTIDGKRFGESTNTGKELIGRIDICESLQKFNECYLPIFLDNAESLNSFNVPEVDTQLILLSVTDDKEIQVL